MFPEPRGPGGACVRLRHAVRPHPGAVLHAQQMALYGGPEETDQLLEGGKRPPPEAATLDNNQEYHQTGVNLHVHT